VRASAASVAPAVPTAQVSEELLAAVAPAQPPNSQRSADRQPKRCARGAAARGEIGRAPMTQFYASDSPSRLGALRFSGVCER
jgi:hypothetical protein